MRCRGGVSGAERCRTNLIQGTDSGWRGPCTPARIELRKTRCVARADDGPTASAADRMATPRSVPPSATRRSVLLALGLAPVAGLNGCASMSDKTKQRQVASMLGYLLPCSEQSAAQSDKVADIQVPLHIGVAFVPDSGDPACLLPETERLALAGKVREALAGDPFVKDIEAVPSLYLEPGGGFDNLERIAALLRLDVVALISCDQVQYAGANRWSFLYWTGIGACVIEGDKYDVLTAVETAVFDVCSRRMLMRAAGTSTLKGEATWVGFAERSRQARSEAFCVAVQQMIGKLQRETQALRERAPKDPMIRLVLPPGYKPRAQTTASPG